MNIWDFGGQEIYHATHQFFLSNRSLYILLADGRLEENLDYWLQVQELLGGNSPLLIVLNQKGTIRQDIPLNDLRGQYANLQQLEKVDLKNDRQGIIRLNTEVEHRIRHLPHLVKGEKLPTSWVRIREALANLPDPYISLKTFRSTCRENGIEEPKKQDFLSSYLHDLGVMLHFQREPLLKDTILLQSEWATDAVYSILDHTKDHATVPGHFTRADLEKVWTDASYQDMFDKLLALMRNFELCFPVPYQTNLFIVPQLLSTDRPEKYHWDHFENIRVRYKYDFKPKGILTRLIVRLHERIVDQEKMLWKRGVVFQNSDQDTFAQVLDLPREKEIDIRIRGTHARELMTIILNEMEQINGTFRFNEKMNVRCLFPCNCSVCLFKDNSNFYDYQVLRHYMARQRQTIECNESFEKVPIFDLIDRLTNLPDFAKHGLAKDQDRVEAAPTPPFIIENKPVFQNMIPPTPAPVAKMESKTLESKATPIPQKWYETWTFKSTLGGLLGGAIIAFILARWTPLPFLDSWLAGGTIITFALLRRNPRNVFKNFAYYSIGMVAIINILPAFKLTLSESNPNGLERIFNLGVEDSPWLSVILVMLAGWSLYLHRQHTKDS